MCSKWPLSLFDLRLFSFYCRLLHASALLMTAAVFTYGDISMQDASLLLLDRPDENGFA